MKLGIIGLPNTGKSTLFNALTKAKVPAESYPFCTIEPNIGTVPVPDERLPILQKIYNAQKIVAAVVNFVDIAGLVKDANKGEGLGNKFLAHIREVDAIIHIVRCFEDNDVIHVDGSIDPLRDIDTIKTELILADIESLENQKEKAEKQIRTVNDKKIKEKLNLIQEIINHLNTGKPAKLFIDSFDDKDELLKDNTIFKSGVTILVLILKRKKLLFSRAIKSSSASLILSIISFNSERNY